MRPDPTCALLACSYFELKEQFFLLQWLGRQKYFWVKNNNNKKKNTLSNWDKSLNYFEAVLNCISLIRAKPNSLLETTLIPRLRGLLQLVTALDAKLPCNLQQRSCLIVVTELLLITWKHLTGTWLLMYVRSLTVHRKISLREIHVLNHRKHLAPHMWSTVRWIKILGTQVVLDLFKNLETTHFLNKNVKSTQ